jgi:hypothetical protein
MTIHAQHQRLPLNVQRFLANRPPWRKMSAAAAGVVAVGVMLTVLAASGGISGLVFGAAAAATALAIAGLSRVMVVDPSGVTTRDMLPAGQRLKRGDSLKSHNGKSGMTWTIDSWKLEGSWKWRIGDIR